MKLIDQVTLTEILLPHDLLWVDEFRWSRVASSSKYSLAGRLIIQSGVKQSGRPISLEPPDASMAWVPRSTHEALRAAASIPQRKFKLVLEYPTDSREFLVVFAPGADPIEGGPVKGFPEYEPDAWFNVKIKLIEVMA